MLSYKNRSEETNKFIEEYDSIKKDYDNLWEQLDSISERLAESKKLLKRSVSYISENIFTRSNFYIPKTFKLVEDDEGDHHYNHQYDLEYDDVKITFRANVTGKKTFVLDGENIVRNYGAWEYNRHPSFSSRYKIEADRYQSFSFEIGDNDDEDNLIGTAKYCMGRFWDEKMTFGIVLFYHWYQIYVMNDTEINDYQNIFELFEYCAYVTHDLDTTDSISDLNDYITTRNVFRSNMDSFSE